MFPPEHDRNPSQAMIRAMQAAAYAAERRRIRILFSGSPDRLMVRKGEHRHPRISTPKHLRAAAEG